MAKVGPPAAQAAGTHTVEPSSTRAGGWLRGRRLRLTLWLAAAEGLLYLLQVLHWWAAVALAVIAVGSWWYFGRHHRSGVVRELSLCLATAQLLVLLVPLVLAIAGAVAIAVVALLALTALVVLNAERP